MVKKDYELIVTIVNKGWASTVVESAQAAGAKGATVFRGRGSGLKTSLFGIPVEPEKDIIFCAVPKAISEHVLLTISQSAALLKQGKGIAFTLPIGSIVGVFEGSSDDGKEKE